MHEVDDQQRLADAVVAAPACELHSKNEVRREAYGWKWVERKMRSGYAVCTGLWPYIVRVRQVSPLLITLEAKWELLQPVQTFRI